MTKFSDGPAAGIVLALRRAPYFIRVVRNGNSEFDALDQLDDKPGMNETVWAYERTEYRGMVHICCRPRGGGYFAMAAYRIMESQPEEAIMRSTPAWVKWCLEQWAEKTRGQGETSLANP